MKNKAPDNEKKNYNKIIIDCNSEAEPDEPEKKKIV